jgi:hypothetical protein
MDKFKVHQFDNETYIVIDTIEQREICICSNYDNVEDAEERAKLIAQLLNEN